MTTREKLARELYRWSYYATPCWEKTLDEIRKQCLREADRIIKLLKGGEK
jgi:hypothetical protein